MRGERVVRSQENRMIAGVAGGIAVYLNVDPLLIRLAFIILLFLNGIGGLIYAILWFLLPSEHSTAPDPRSQVLENVEEVKSSIQQFIQWVRGLFK